MPQMGLMSTMVCQLIILASGPDDVIFVNIAGNGGPGYVSFPEDFLFLDDFLEAINWMYDNHKYSKLIIYVEASYAGSLFHKTLPDGKNVYALTSTGPFRTSSAAYWDEVRKTYLSDVFSTLWMTYTQDEKISKFNLLYDTLDPNISRAEEYGDLKIGVKKLKTILETTDKRMLRNPSTTLHLKDTVNSINVPLNILQSRLKDANNSKQRNKLKGEIKQLKDKRKIIYDLFIDILKAVTSTRQQQNNLIEKLEKKTEPLTTDIFPCYRMLFTNFYYKYGSLLEDPYNCAHLQKFVNICSNKGLKKDLVVKAIMYGKDAYPPRQSSQNGSCSFSPGTVKSFCSKYKRKVISHKEKGEWKIVCQDSILELTCGTSKYIEINDALWGRFDKSTCGTYPDMYKNCTTVDDTFIRVFERCQFKSHCYINTTITEFGEPCVYFNKYLMVNFACQYDPIQYETVTVEQSTSKYIKCDKKTSIIIINAHWGRKAAENDGVNCLSYLSNYTTDIVSARCDYMHECKIHAHTDWFGDPCLGKKKHLNITYQCIGVRQDPMFIKTCGPNYQIKCPDHHRIAIDWAYYGRSHPFMCNPLTKMHVPRMDEDCVAELRMKEVEQSCMDKNECTGTMTDATEPCKSFEINASYVFIIYACVGPDGNRSMKYGNFNGRLLRKMKDADDDYEDDNKVDLSPGPPTIVTLTSNSVTFEIPNTVDSELYGVQIKPGSGDTWFDLHETVREQGVIYDLVPETLYDIRFILKSCDNCNDELCIPFTRIITKSIGTEDFSLKNAEQNPENWVLD
ncbi:unnamed protein product [Nezara viridula]|uniref:SUEL-type lectin domain-containing protein n=1 Tax=Nezara viridula TaxID=85310 RepID=A0A9P0MND1_NEZVI|nr:unnamed protein product [Nezara viridula]